MSSKTYSTTTGLHDFHSDVPGTSAWLDSGLGINVNLFNFAYHQSDVAGVGTMSWTQDNDSTIPSASTVSNIEVIYTVAMQTDVSAFNVAPYIRYNGGSQVFGASFNYPVADTPYVYTRTYATDPNGAAWTPANFYIARFGIQVDQDLTSSTPEIFQLTRTVNFICPAPTATTNAATNTTVSTATLNGTVGPNTATASFPVQYKFQYGPTAAYGTETALTGALTGSGSIAVTANISGLTGFSTYHYRVVAVNADVTTNGNDQTFATAPADLVLMSF